jgi:hypothetical protein
MKAAEAKVVELAAMSAAAEPVARLAALNLADVVAAVVSASRLFWQV